MIKRTAQLFKNEAFLRFLLVGTLAFCVEFFSFFVGFNVLRMPLIVANSLSFILGLLTSFTLNRIWTFHRRNYKNRIPHQFAYYIALAGVNLILTNIIVETLHAFGVEPNIGKLIAMGVTSLWNFFIYRSFVFKKRIITEDT